MHKQWESAFTALPIQTEESLSLHFSFKLKSFSRLIHLTQRSYATYITTLRLCLCHEYLCIHDT